MTFSEIVDMALVQLEYGTDESTRKIYFPKFIIHANSAIENIAREIGMKRVETIELSDGIFSVSMLSKPLVKICEITADGKRVEFREGDNYGEFSVATASNQVKVCYKYIPKYCTAGNAQPEIPEVYHPIIYLYIVHMHYNTGAGQSDLDRTKWLQMFIDAKRRLTKTGYGNSRSYAFENLP